MKMRQGFVSNSSSSSFCIYGIQFESGREAIEALKKGDSKVKEKFIASFNEGYKNELESPVTNIDELIDSIDDLYLYDWEFISELFEEHKLLSYHTGSEYNEDMISIGREWCYIGDKETGEEFKNSITEALQYYFGKKIKCSTIEESLRC